jgi:D-3-phosphoglycerate dehydrogenase / 2-oxoglutarate reductase
LFILKSTMKKNLISDSIDKNCISILHGLGYEVAYRHGMTPIQIKDEIGNYNGLIVRSETKVNADLISQMAEVEIIGRAGTGVDNIDVDAATRRGIIVMNTPGGSTISAAEHRMALMLSMCRNVRKQIFLLEMQDGNGKNFKEQNCSVKFWVSSV